MKIKYYEVWTVCQEFMCLTIHTNVNFTSDAGRSNYIFLFKYYVFSSKYYFFPHELQIFPQNMTFSLKRTTFLKYNFFNWNITLFLMTFLDNLHIYFS